MPPAASTCRRTTHPRPGAILSWKNAPAVVRAAREVVEGGLFFLDLTPRPSPTADERGAPGLRLPLLGFDTARGRVRAVVGGEPTRAVCTDEDIAAGGRTSACAGGSAASGSCRARRRARPARYEGWAASGVRSPSPDGSRTGSSR